MAHLTPWCTKLCAGTKEKGTFYGIVSVKCLFEKTSFFKHFNVSL